MGMLVDWMCSQCGYAAVVSGGDDVGMAAATTTIVCRGCQKLYDVVTSRKPWLEKPAGWEARLRCPTRIRRHVVEQWTGPGACPRCGATIEPGRKVVMWD